MVYTLDPPTRACFHGVPVLTSLPEKLSRFEAPGLDYVVVANFDAVRTSQSAEELSAPNPEEVWTGLPNRRSRIHDTRKLERHFTTRMLES